MMNLFCNGIQLSPLLPLAEANLEGGRVDRGQTFSAMASTSVYTYPSVEELKEFDVTRVLDSRDTWLKMSSEYYTRDRGALQCNPNYGKNDPSYGPSERSLLDAYVAEHGMSFENTLRIEYTETDVSRIIKVSKQKLENAYQCRLDQPVYTVQAQNELVSENLNVFLQELAECLKQLTALTSISMFTKKPPINLADVNYLGFTSETLTTALKYLQDRVCYEKRSTIVPALVGALNNVEMSQIKRLFIVMLVMEKLGIYEGVAACAQLLYIGGLVL